MSLWNKYIYQSAVLLELTGFNTELENLIWCLRELFKLYDKLKNILQILLLLIKLVKDTVAVSEKSAYSSWAFVILHFKEKVGGFTQLGLLKLN